MKIELTKLLFKQEPNHDEDTVSIFTRMGIHKPGVPMGHKCMVAEVYCGDTTDLDDSAYQIAQLFISASGLLKACEKYVELIKKASEPDRTQGEIGQIGHELDAVMETAIAAAKGETP